MTVKYDEHNWDGMNNTTIDRPNYQMQMQIFNVEWKCNSVNALQIIGEFRFVYSIRDR